MTRIALPRLITVLGLLAICLGAGSSRSCSFSSGDTDKDDPDFVTDLKLQNADGQITDTFAPGAPIDMVLTVRNRLDTPAEAQFPTARTSDFVVVRENTTDVVWKWSTGRAFGQVVTTLTFAANETKTFTFRWNQVGDNGNPLANGTYEARGVLVYDDFDSNPLKSNQMGSTLVRFVIR